MKYSAHFLYVWSECRIGHHIIDQIEKIVLVKNAIWKQMGIASFIMQLQLHADYWWMMFLGKAQTNAEQKRFLPHPFLPSKKTYLKGGTIALNVLVLIPSMIH